MQDFHQQFKQPIIDEKRSYEDDEITEQLNSAPDGGIMKHYKFH
jgi:hypothetical protein